MFSHAKAQSANCSKKVRLFDLFRFLSLRAIFCTGNKLRLITLLTVMHAVPTQLVISASACLGINEKIPFLFFLLG